MRLHEKAEEAWKKFREDAEQYGAEHAQDEEFGSYTDRDPISETWLTRGKLVRLDDAIMALHLMAARHSFRGVATLRARLITKVRGYFVGFLASAGARKLLGQVIGRNSVGQLASLVASTISESGTQREVESSIRVASFEVRADLYREPMKTNPNRPRKTKVVYTRHPIPKQRKANKAWRSPKR